MLLCHLVDPKSLVNEGSHLLVERTWKRIGKKGSKANCIDVFYHVVKEVSVRSERKSTNIIGKFDILKYLQQETKILKPSTPKPTKGLFSSI